jgi:hypothetical protein
METIEQFRAYAVGYYDGRAEGIECNPYRADHLRHAYRQGYDAGVADFDPIATDSFTGRAVIKGE